MKKRKKKHNIDRRVVLVPAHKHEKGASIFWSVLTDTGTFTR